MEDPSPLLAALVDLARNAGAVIMQMYKSDFSISRKADKTPVTEADQRAEALILEGLANIAPTIPVIAEEAAAAGHLPPPARRFFLVDPLDGTREFISRNGEFTVNIALVEDHCAQLGVIFAPACNRLFAGAAGLGAFELDAGSSAPASTLLTTARTLTGAARMQTVAKDDARKRIKALTSRSHADPETDGFLKRCGIDERLTAGSSLKFCLLAAGAADVYPRFGPTMEWDTAAGQAILQAAGGMVLTRAGTPLRYGKVEDGYRNPAFIAWANPGLRDDLLGSGEDGAPG